MANIISQTDIQQGLMAARIERARMFVIFVATAWRGMKWMARFGLSITRRRKPAMQMQTAA